MPTNAPVDMPTRKLYTMNEVRDILRVSRSTLYRMKDSGELKPVSVGGAIRYLVTDVDAYIESLTQ